MRTSRITQPPEHEYRSNSIEPRLYVCPAFGMRTRASDGSYTIEIGLFGLPTRSTTVPVASTIRYSLPTAPTFHVSPEGIVATVDPDCPSPSRISTGPACASSRTESSPWASPIRRLFGGPFSRATRVPE